MSKHPRRENVQEGRRSSDVTGLPPKVPEAPPEAPEPTPESDPPLEPKMAARYWLAIVLWCIGFVIMIVYEMIAAIWRG